jgi:hypothetical protein
VLHTTRPHVRATTRSCCTQRGVGLTRSVPHNEVETNLVVRGQTSVSRETHKKLFRRSFFFMSSRRKHAAWKQR